MVQPSNTSESRIYTANLSDYLKTTEIVEEEFGSEWLLEKSQTAREPNSSDYHPIPVDWKVVKDAQRDFHATGIFHVSEPLIRLSSFARDLSLARSLANYESVIKKRLTDANEIAKVQYEIYVAGLFVRSGRKPEFIPQQMTKSPDLKLFVNDFTIFIECTRRDAFQPTDPGGKKVFGSVSEPGTLCRQVTDLVGELQASHHVMIVSFGKLESTSFESIIHGISEGIRSGKEGLFVDLKRLYGLGIYRIPQPTPEQGVGLFIPKGLNPAFTFGTIAEDDQGRQYMKNPCMFSLYQFESHRLKSIISSFTDKRKQIPKSGCGLLYIDIDVTQLHENEVGAYLEIVSAILKSQFTPSTNTRIGGVVLTTTPTFVETEKDGLPFITLHRQMRVIRNPYGRLPHDFAIPGEHN